MTVLDDRPAPGAVVLDGVRFAYRRGPSFGPFDLLLEPRTLNVLVGPSGSGKSTLLSLLGSLLRPEAGRISVARGPGATRAVRADDAAWVFQQSNALAARTVLDNVLLPARARGRISAADVEEAESALARVGLDGVAARQCRDLSGGERQRMCVARSLTMRRPLILADEATGQLDRSNSRRVVEALRAASETTIVVLATHDREAMRSADLVLELSDGVVRAHAG